MDRKLLKMESRKQLSGNISTFIVSYLIIGAFGWAISLICNFLPIPPHLFSVLATDWSQKCTWINAFQMPGGVELLPILIKSTVTASVSLFLSFFIAAPFALSMSYMSLKVSHNGKTELSETFSGFSRYGKSLWLMFLIVFWETILSLLFIIPGIIASYSYKMSFFVLAENPNLTGRQAMLESKRLMKGHRWEYFVFELSFFWWYLLCIVTLGIATFYVAPYMMVAATNFYNRLKENDKKLI